MIRDASWTHTWQKNTVMMQRNDSGLKFFRRELSVYEQFVSENRPDACLPCSKSPGFRAY